MTGSGAAEGARAFPNLVDQDSFHLLLHLELQKAMRLRYCVSVVAVAIDAPGGCHGSDVESEFARGLAEEATRRLRGTDVVTTLSPTCIGLMLIDAEASVVAPIVNRAAEHWEGTPPVRAGRPWKVRWRAGAGCFPQTAHTAAGLVRQATELMARAHPGDSQRVYVAT